VFIDETWTATNMTRSHGRCPKGERLRIGFPHGHRKTTTLVAGLRMTGMVAPMVFDGPINGDWFEAYVTQVLVPELKPGDVVIMDNLSSHKRVAVKEEPELKPGDVVIMDNLSSHKRVAVKEEVEAAGVPRCASSRLTAPTSIQSRRRSPVSRPCCERLASAPFAASGT